jgi:hypothetical protein
VCKQEAPVYYHPDEQVSRHLQDHNILGVHTKPGSGLLFKGFQDFLLQKQHIPENRLPPFSLVNRFQECCL